MGLLHTQDVMTNGLHAAQKSGLRCRCIDGRGKTHGFGMPGGSIVPFLYAAEALRTEIGRDLSQAEVSTLLLEYAEKGEGVYMHSDMHAVHTLIETASELVSQFWSDFSVNESMVLEWLRFGPSDAPLAFSLAFVDALVMPQHIGCGHIRLMLTNPEKYGISPSLIEKTMRAFFMYLFSGNEFFVYELLEGDHAEQEIVAIESKILISNITFLPMIKPENEQGQAFVYHPQMELEKIKEAVALLRGGLSAKSTEQVVVEYATQLAKNALKHTAEKLAAQLPTVTLTY